MTSLTTVLGLVPIVAALDVPGGEILAPLAAVQFGGLVVATVAALVVVPALSVLVAPRAVVPSLQTSPCGKDVV